MTAISNRTLQDIPPSGVYHLTLRLGHRDGRDRRGRRIRIGALGGVFVSGGVLYTGRGIAICAELWQVGIT